MTVRARPASSERWLARSLAHALVHAVALVALACGPSSGVAVPSDAPPLRHAPLVDFVPAAGLRWLVVGSPRQLAAAPALAPLQEHWLTEERRRAFARMTGVDLWVTEHALVAGFDLGTLYLVDASGWVTPPERAFIARLAGSERLDQPHPRILRVTGIAGTQPETLVRIADELVAIAVGDPTLARVVELRARGELERLAPALEGASLGVLPDDLHHTDALSIYVPGPLDAAWVSADTSLLGSTQALAITLTLEGDPLTLGVALAGHWHPAQDLPRLLDTWNALGESALGRELALDRPLAPTDTAGSETLLRLRTQLDGRVFSAGLARLLSGEIGKLTF